MKISQEPMTYLFRKLWEFSKGRRKQVVIFSLFSMIANLLHFLYPLILAHIINIIQFDGVTAENIRTILLWSSSFIVLELITWVFHGTSRIMENLNAYFVRYSFQRKLVGNILSFPMKWHGEHESGNTIDKISKSSEALFTFSSGTFVIYEGVFSLITSVGAILYLNSVSLLSIAIFIVSCVLLIFFFDRIIKRNLDIQFKLENKIAAKIYDSVSNISSIIILRIEDLVSKEILKTMMAPFQTFKKIKLLNEAKWFTISIFVAMLYTVILATYIYNTYNSGEVILIGTVSALFLYVERLSNFVYRFAFNYSGYVEHKAKIQNAEELLNKENKIQMKTPKTSAPSFPKKWSTLGISLPEFTYEENRKTTHLEPLNLTIKKKEKIALIGESGSGKTTFLKIIRGLYETEDAQITTDEINTLPLESFSEQTLLIPQDPEIFATTIRENITVGIPHSLATVKKHTDLALFTDVVGKLPNKWESNINERGVNLSGGQKQRLALARALLATKGREFILMDESTSSVDPKNELTIYQNIFKEYNDRVIIASIHKLNLLKLFDRVIMLKEGQVIADGTFTKLLRTSPEFKDLWKKFKEAEKEA